MRNNIAKLAVLVLTAAAGVVVAAAPAQADYSSTPRATTWSPNAPSGARVYALARIGNTIYLGGDFTTLRAPTGTQTVTRNRLAAIDANTGALLPWNPGANGVVRTLEPSADGQTIYVGGAFTTAGGSSRPRIAQLRVLNGTATSFAVTGNGQVNTLELSGSRLFAGGTFTNLRGRSRIAALDPTTGALLAGWNGSADGNVNKILASQDGSSLYVGGQFRVLSGASHSFLGAVNALDGSANPWNPPIPCTDTQNPCYVFDLASDGTRVYAGVGGPGGRVVAYDPSSGARRWTAYGDGDVQAIAVQGGIVYAGGHFDPLFAQQNHAGIAALSAGTGGILPFAAQATGGLGVWDILAEPTILRIGGGFTRLNGSGTRQRYAEFDAIGVGQDGTPPSVPGDLRTTVLSDNVVSLSWDASTDDGTVTGYRVLRDGVALVDAGVTNYTDRDLVASTAYSYTVQAVDAAGNWSTPTDPLLVTTQDPSNALVHVSSAWRYLSNGSDQGTAWTAPGFVDSGWSLGTAQLGFGDDDETTVISPLGLTHYFRSSFTVADPTLLTGLTLNLLRDDGAVVYLNGVEVLRDNLPAGPVTYQTPAASDVSGSDESTFSSFSIPATGLVAGTNTIAVEVHNRTGSSDVSFDAELLPVF